MRRILLALLTGIGLAVSAPVVMGQRLPTPSFALPPESVTVTATRPSDETIRNFEETREQPTYVLGRMARWTKPICPLTIGLSDKYARYVTQRIEDIARAVGAPVGSNPCGRPNIEVMFTLSPQILLDNVHKDEPLLLGYHHNEREADELAKVTHSIQAWYSTTSQDVHGDSHLVDDGTCRFGGTSMAGVGSAGADAAGVSSGFTAVEASFPCAVVTHSTGSRAVDGLDSGFFNIVIVADPSKLHDFELGSLADYIAMLALSQPASLDNCQELPSISNLLAKNCATVPGRIADGDLAFLKGLYWAPSGLSMATQRNEIRYEMKRVLVTNKGG